MQRQIKFRGKRLDGDGGWVYGDLLQQESGNVTIMVHEESNWHQPWQVDPETVGQYTGFHDNANVDIYENDYVKLSDDRVYFVDWSQGGGYWYLVGEDDEIPGDDRLLVAHLGWIEVTDTPDLVEGGRAV